MNNDKHAVTAWKCTTCGKRLGAIKKDDDGREYRECDCTRNDPRVDVMRGRLKQFAPHWNYNAPEDFEPSGYNVEAFELSLNDLLICRISIPVQSIGRTVQRPAYVILQAMHWEEYGNHYVDWKRYGDLDRVYDSLNQAIGAAVGELFADDLSVSDQAEEEERQYLEHLERCEQEERDQFDAS